MARTQIKGTQILDGTVNTVDLADDCVTAAKIADTSVTPGSYYNTSITVDQQGRVTAASNGPRVASTASSSTPTPDSSTTDFYILTALAANAVFAAPTGSPTQGQLLLIRIKDNGSARTLGWNAVYRASTDFALPTTTVISKTMYVQFIYNSTDSVWDCIGLTDGF